MDPKENLTNVTVSKTIQTALKKAFAKNKGNIAIRYGEETYTYDYIDAESNRICIWLIENNMSNGKHIALCLKDNTSLIIWIFAILKARSVFVPLDYNHPTARTKELLKICEADILITDAQGKLTFKSLQIDIIDHQEIHCISVEDISTFTTNINYAEDDKIYIYFTSGSTGTPKAIVGKNESLNHFINWEIRTLGLDYNTKVSQFINPSFDAFLRDVFPVILVGGTLCIPDFKIENSISLINWIYQSEINLIHCVPSFFKLLVSSDLKENHFQNLKYILLSGEKVNTKDLSNWYKTVGDKVQLVNLYGATETTMIKTYYFIKPEDANKLSIPIGKPIHGTQLFLLDEALKPVAKNSIGEIYIRTKYGTYGYYNNEILTQEKFIKNPYATDSNDVLYKTGDLGRFDSNQDLEFLGRIDRQIKMRGIRVEPEEIEKHISNHEGISQVIIKAFQDKNEDYFLGAYLIGNEELNQEDLRVYLSQYLPAYLIPEYFVFLSSFPFLANGKVDMNSLPNPKKLKKEDIIAPITKEQEKMVQLWSQVLERDSVSIGVNNSFIELGGNSLKLIFLANKIRQEFQVEISLNHIIELQTIAKLCDFILNSETIILEKILPATQSEFYPLSSAQKRMYFLNEYSPESTVYNMTRVLTIYGELDKNRLSKAFTQLIGRHEILRTSFEILNEEPVQKVHSKIDFSIIELKDVKNLQQSISGFIEPFNLSDTSLMRVGLIEKTKEEYVLIIDNHHIISDGLSHKVLLKDFIRLYNKERLPELELQYKDYAVWQQSVQQKLELSLHKEFWMSEFSEVDQVLELPIDFERPQLKTYEGKAVSFTLDKQVTEGLRNLSVELQSTLFAVVFSIYNVLIHKLTNNKNIIIGVPAADRQHNSLENVIGMLANTLAVKNHLEADQLFIEFVYELKQKMLLCIQYQKFQYEDLVEELNLERDPTRNPLFDVMFVYNEADDLEYKLDHVAFEPYRNEVTTSKFDLLMGCSDTGDQLDCSLEYSTDIFSEETIERFVDYFKYLTSQILVSPKIRIGQLELLNEVDKQELHSFNLTKNTDEYSETTFHGWFAKQVLKTPNEIALTFSGKKMTYKELEEKSNQLARYLKTKGVSINSIVGIMQHRSFEMVISILGILKSGGAYLPIDFSNPLSRIKRMVADSNMLLLLTDNSTEEILKDSIEIENISVFDYNSYNSKEIENTNSKEDLLYILYTSGSTGIPKGVMLTHGNLINLINFDLYGTTINTKSVLQFTPLTFDPSFAEIFTALLTGGTLHILSEEEAEDFTAILSHIQQYQVQTIWMPSSVLNQLFNSTMYADALPNTLTDIVTAGEQVVLGDRLKHYIIANEITLHNHYGPSETHSITTNTLAPNENLPKMPSIGKPVQNTQIYILNEERKLQPIGVAGELYIGGAQLGKGYLNREKLNNERFVSNPFGTGKLYRTGDLSKWNKEGEITFLGRIDYQIKLNGIRVEPGEIESHLNDIEGIDDSAVLLQNISGHRVLVGYYLSKEELSKDMIRDYLLKHLPLSMIPNHFVPMKSFPKTSSGKLHRKSLPKIDLLLDEYIEPTNEIEKSLVSIWSEIIQKDPSKISIGSSFFSLGGNSLKAMVLVNTINKVFHVKIPLKLIFQYQTIAGLGGLIETKDKELFVAIPKAAELQYYPLSSAQKRMFFLYEYDKQSLSYNSLKVVKLNGQLDKERLEMAFQQLINRHESFRTVFSLKDGVPVQKIIETVDFNINDIGSVSDVESEIRSFIKPFNLNGAPLLRVGLIKLSHKEHLLLVDNHHIISDGVTNGLLLKEFMSIYKGDALPELHIQYKDYAVWQQSSEQQALLEKQRAFWLNLYLDDIPTLELSTDYPRPEVNTNSGAVLDFNLDAETTSKLSFLAKEEQTTMFVVLHSIYTILLSKLSGQEDIIVGTSVSGRYHADLENVAGVFINALALRSKPKGNINYLDYLRTLKEDVFSFFEHQEYPYEDLIDALKLKRDTRRAPLFNVMFEYFNFEQPTIEIPELELEPYEYKIDITRFDLTLRVLKETDELKLSFQYSSELFEHSTIVCYIEYFKRLVSEIVKNHEVSISDIQMQSLSEQKLLLETYNATEFSNDSQRNILNVFASQVALHPNQTAVHYKGDSYSYSELDARSNQLANYLRSRKIVPGDMVGLLLDRSLDMIVGVLGVLKSGAAYMPIGPSLPEQRISYMLDQSRSSLLLSDMDYIERFSAYLPVVDMGESFIWDSSSEAVEVDLRKEDIAYCIFTSGSSGKPKGVVMSHGSVLNLIKGLEHTVYKNYESGLRVSLLASYAFDASVQQIFGSLLLGHSLYIADDISRKDGLELLNFYNTNKIAVSDGTPTHLRMLLNSLQGDEVLGLQGWILAGEYLDKSLVTQFYETFDTGIDMYNFYGPTETCVDSTYFKIIHEDLSKYTTIPIGKPLPNERVYVTDAYGNIVPKGVMGELCIAGLGLAKCYIGNPELTAERFVVNWLKCEDRVYRTGDMVRWLPDGNLEYCGRIDDQVKLRGYRIELSEIEYKLNSISEIVQSVVLLKEREGEDFLVGYYESEAAIEGTLLRERLSKELPDYMLPSYYVHMEKLPVSLSGKIAKKELPEFDMQLTNNYEAASNETEERLVAIWSEVLKLDPEEIGVTTDFFELGGHSLKMVFLANKIKKEYGVSVALKKLIELSTIESLSTYLLEQEKKEYVSIPKALKSDYYPLTSSQKRMYFLYEYNKQSLAYNSVKVVKLLGAVDKNRLQLAFQQLIDRHESFRTIFLLSDGIPVQYIHENVKFEIDDIGTISDVKDGISNFVTPFNLSQGPLLRVGLIQLSAEEHLLLVDNHHIISDGVTNGILLKEFMSIYKGETLPELQLQYKDYAVWQQSIEQQSILEKQRSFWLDTFSGDIPTLELPTDYSRPETSTNSGTILEFHLDTDTTSKLSSLAKEEQTTLFVVLHSIYTILLSRLGGEEDIIVGTSVAGRHHADLEGIAGVFINALALRSRPKGNIGYLEYLRESKENIFASFEHQEYPYEDLIDALKLKRDTRRPPLFNVMFEYFNFEQPTIEIPGLELIPYEYEVDATRFDLTLRVSEKSDGLLVGFQYSSELFDRSSIEKLVTYFQSLVASILSNTSLALKELQMLSLSDQYLLLNTYNATELSYNMQDSLLNNFESQVILNPDRIAIHYRGDYLSYLELDARSNQLANYLCSCKIVPGNMVGLLLDRSLDMIIGILGVLKSGAGYLPIDPSLPEQRVSYMLDQSRTSLLLSEIDYIERFSAYLPVVDIGNPLIWSSSSEAVEVGLTKEDIAYCIFTSGSSGKPKGVMMSHGSVLNLVKGLEHTVYKSYESGLRVSLLASYAFDASVQQIFGVLLLGHSLYIADDVSRKDGLALLNFYNTHKIALSDGTPTHLRMLLNSLEGSEELKYLQGWILAGEYLDKSLVIQFYETFDTGINMYNFYGPTETCVDSTFFKIIPEELSQYTTVPIGKPLPNERVYITDQYGSLVAPGVQGELCIAGSGLARCYVGNQEMTTEHFVTDWLECEDRVYRTGDMARWLSNGNLEYCGRIDDQVKLRGYRIELSEIEYQLNNISEIVQSVVLLKERAREEFLVGYYESEGVIESSILRERLSKELPDYMLPNYYVHMEKLPVNLSGKIAKKELPEFDVTVTSNYESASNETEERLVTIWSEVLKLDAEKIGVTTDFFELGGHSLNGIQIANTISKQLGVNLKLIEIFKKRTIREISELIEMDKWLEVDKVEDSRRVSKETII